MGYVITISETAGNADIGDSERYGTGELSGNLQLCYRALTLHCVVRWRSAQTPPVLRLVNHLANRARHTEGRQDAVVAIRPLRHTKVEKRTQNEPVMEE